VSRILAFGDSLTEGESSGVANGAGRPASHDPATPGVPQSYPAKLQALIDARYTAQDVAVFNGGRGGERASEGMSRLLDLIDRFEPQVLILMTGVNDLNGGASIEATAGHVEDLVKAARGLGLAVLLSTLPRQVETGRRAGSLDLIAPYNLLMQAIAIDEGVTLVDIHPHLTDPFITPDGLHITEAGNALLASLYFDAIKARFDAAGSASARFYEPP
jgi:lysophospholipase L1-like esterase